MPIHNRTELHFLYIPSSYWSQIPTTLDPFYPPQDSRSRSSGVSLQDSLKRMDVALLDSWPSDMRFRCSARLATTESINATMTTGRDTDRTMSSSKEIAVKDQKLNFIPAVDFGEKKTTSVTQQYTEFMLDTWESKSQSMLCDPYFPFQATDQKEGFQRKAYLWGAQCTQIDVPTTRIAICQLAAAAQATLRFCTCGISPNGFGFCTVLRHCVQFADRWCFGCAPLALQQ